LAKDILGAPATILGEWSEKQVILLRGKHSSPSVPINQHKLRSPFNGRNFRGDILLYRVNGNGKAENFTLSEYQNFVAQPDENAAKQSAYEPCVDERFTIPVAEKSFTAENEEEEEPAMSQEELRREIAEAFEIIRERGRNDAQYLAELVSETFYEINGREAELDDIAKVFKRVKEQLAEEAEEESDDSVDEVCAAVKALLVTDESSTTVPAEKRESLLKYAREVVTEVLATQAREKFIQISGREPTTQEFEDLLISLSTGKVVEADFPQDEESDSDYNPSDEVEQAQARADELEEAAEEKASAEVSPAKCDVSAKETLSEKKPIKFFSPVRTKKTAQRLTGGLDSVDRKLMDRVVQHFNNIHKREPTESERANLWKFLTTGDLPSYDGEKEVNDENKSPNVRKVNFDSDANDSEYVPEEEENSSSDKDTQESQEVTDVIEEIQELN